MKTAARLPLLPIRRESEDSRLAGVRSQAAFVRTLLDEVERVAPSGTGNAVSTQLVEELARLGCRFLEVASALSTTMEVEAPPSGLSSDVSRCA